MSNEVTKSGGTAIANPFGDAKTTAPTPYAGNALMTAESQRAIAEIQASCIMAMQFPRNPQVAVDRILNECQRKTLAEVAIYSFPRGGQQVSGPSIRLAEVLKRHWQHIHSGWRCLERGGGRSLIEAFANDLQNNVSERRTFEVRHIRDTKKGQKPLTDERDIYEMEANQAARRVRACILALIDGDVIEAAVDQCEKTLAAQADTSPEGIKKMLAAFLPYDVTKAMIEARIGRNIESITAAQIVNLRSVLMSMKDGMSGPENWFDMSLAPGEKVKGKPSPSLDKLANELDEKVDPETGEVTEEAAEAAQESADDMFPGDQPSVPQKDLAAARKAGEAAYAANQPKEPPEDYPVPMRTEFFQGYQEAERAAYEAEA